MKKIFNTKKLFKKLLIIGIFLYSLCTFIGQQKTINAYKNEKELYANKIKQAKTYKNELVAVKENINSPEYIEEVAREKLDMYLPNERVYIDISQ